jgi:hypothetical protein
LGVGPNATGPGPSIPTQALPGTYGQGLLINQPDRYLQFGPVQSLPNTLGNPIATLPAMPITKLDVMVNNSNNFISVPSIVDSGGVQGTLPSGLNAQPGQLIQVFAQDDHTTPLYTFTYGQNYSPVPISSGLMNTGNLLFKDHPVFIDYVTGQAKIYQ